MSYTKLDLKLPYGMWEDDPTSDELSNYKAMYEGFNILFKEYKSLPVITVEIVSYLDNTLDIVRELMAEEHLSEPLGTGPLAIALELCYARLWTYALRKKDKKLVEMFGTLTDKECSICGTHSSEVLNFNSCKYGNRKYMHSDPLKDDKCTSGYHAQCIIDGYRVDRDHMWPYCMGNCETPFVVSLSSYELLIAFDLGEFENLLQMWADATDCDRLFKTQMYMYAILFLYHNEEIEYEQIEKSVPIVLKHALSLPMIDVTTVDTRLLTYDCKGTHYTFVSHRSSDTIPYVILNEALNECLDTGNNSGPCFKILANAIKEYGFTAFELRARSVIMDIPALDDDQRDELYKYFTDLRPHAKA